MAASLGLPAGLPVIAGAGDGQCAGLGLGATNPGSAYLNLGTSISLGVYLPGCPTFPGLRTLLTGYSDRSAVETLLPAGGLSLAWLRETIKDGDGDLEDRARHVPPGANGLTFIPYMTGRETPSYRPRDRGGFSGLEIDHGPAEMFRAMLEGLAGDQRLNLDHLTGITGAQVDTIAVTGGLANSNLVRQVFADALGLPLDVAVEPECTALGAAIIAAAALDPGRRRFDDVASEMASRNIRVLPQRPTSRVDRTVGPPISLQSINSEGLGEIALAAARAGAEAITALLQTSPTFAPAVKSAPHDLVTAADHASEAAILEVLQHRRPDDPVIGEETGAHHGVTDTRWLVDPLDGTVNFVYGRYGWAVSVGAERDGQPIAGAVICPGDGRWAASDDAGVRHGGFPPAHEPLVSRPPVLVPSGQDTSAADALISIGHPYPTDERERVLDAIRMLVGRVRGIRLTGTAASELLGLAGGDCDAFVAFNLPPWDLAGGLPLVMACGGTVRTLPMAYGMRVTIVTRSTTLADQLAIWLTSP